MPFRVSLSVLLAVFALSCSVFGAPQAAPQTVPSVAAASVAASDSVPGSAVASESRRRLVEKIEAEFDTPRFANAFWGVVIQSLATGEVWYERNADKLFMPASNQKIPTTVAALLELGPDFRFETRLCHNGMVQGSTLRGNLVVFGNGDPTLYNRFFKDTREVFREWAAELKAKGIRQITGDIIGDDNAFDDTHLGFGWPFDQLDRWYSAEFGALQLNENYIDFTVAPPKSANQPAIITPYIPSDYITLVNNIQVVSGQTSSVSITRAHGTNEFVFSGRIGLEARPFERSLSITNPTLFYVTVLKEVLEAEGIEVGGAARDCDDIPGWSASPDAMTLLVLHRSPPLADILTMLMKRSQNMFAETMVHTMGWKRTGTGSFSAGRAAVVEHLEKFGIGPDEYRYRDASGLTRYNLVSPRALIKMLVGMKETPHWEVWRNTMPIAGVDGTLRSRMRGTPAEGNVRAKTGTIAYTRGLSGYVTTAAGEPLVFSFLVNSHTLSAADTNTVTDAVCVLLADYDPAPRSH